MTDAEATLRDHLLTNAALTALVGTRVYAAPNPPAQYTPASGACIVFGVRGGVDNYSGATLEPSVQYRCYGPDLATARRTSRALYEALVDKPGVHVRQSRLETLPQVLTDPETGWDYVWSAFKHWLANI